MSFIREPPASADLHVRPQEDGGEAVYAEPQVGPALGGATAPINARHVARARGRTRRGVQEDARNASADDEAWSPGARLAARIWKDMVGRTLGNFRLVKPLAAGGMGAVFLARKGVGRLSQPAAVKLVHPHLATQRDFVDMFLDEARIASLVHHPNVCRVLDFGVAEGTYYLAMEYVQGETWGEVAARLSARPEGRAVLPSLTSYVLAQACEGLHAAHVATDDAGTPLSVVHRDVSPQNVFVAYDGSVRVLDFGVARAVDRLTSTRAGVVKGKMAYMAPEQVLGEAIDCRVDVWALGVLLREALEGEPLFRRDSDTQILRAVVQDPLPPWCPGIPERLQRIADRALSREPAQRFASAREMGLELTRFVSEQVEPMNAAELSAWMHRMFEAHIARKRELLRAEPPEPPPAAALPPEAPEGVVEVRARRGHRQYLGYALAVLLGVVSLSGLNYVGGTDSTVEQRAAEDLPPASGRTPPPARRAAPRRADPLPAVVRKPEVSAPDTASDSSAAPRQTADVSDTRVEAGTDKPAEKAAPGTLLIAYPAGWAEIYSGRRRLGTTPGRFRLEAGTHVLIVKPFGKEPGFSRRVEVASGRATKLIARE